MRQEENCFFFFFQINGANGEVGRVLPSPQGSAVPWLWSSHGDAKFFLPTDPQFTHQPQNAAPAQP